MDDLIHAVAYPGDMEDPPRRGRPPKLVVDSYHAEQRDLRNVRRIARREGISKASFIRKAVKLAIVIYENGGVR